MSNTQQVKTGIPEFPTKGHFPKLAEGTFTSYSQNISEGVPDCSALAITSTEPPGRIQTTVEVSTSTVPQMSWKCLSFIF